MCGWVIADDGPRYVTDLRPVPGYPGLYESRQARCYYPHSEAFVSEARAWEEWRRRRAAEPQGPAGCDDTTVPS